MIHACRAENLPVSTQLDGEVVPWLARPVELGIGILRIAPRDLAGGRRIVRIAVLPALYVETAKGILGQPVFHAGRDGVGEIENEDTVAFGDPYRITLLAHLAAVH